MSAPLLLAEMLADSPRGLWLMDEPSGNPQDSSGNARHMTASAGTPTYGVTNIFGVAGAIGFDGTASFFSSPDNALLDLGDVFTYEALVERGAAGGGSRGLISKGTGAGYLRLESDGTVTLLRSNVAELVSSTIVVPATGWHHVAATKNGATVALYIDGVDVTGAVTNSTCVSTNSLQYLGNQNGSSEYFNGNMSHAAVYATALGPDRIAAHFAAIAAAPGIDVLLLGGL